LNEFKDFKEIPNIPKETVKPLKNRDRVPIYKPHAKETVVNSECIRWKPVDRVAVRVVAKAQWYNQPPVNKPKYMKPEIASTQIHAARVKTKTVLGEDGYRETLVDADGLTKMAAADLVKTAPKTEERAEQLVERAREASDTLRILMQNIGPNWDEFQDVMNRGIANARQSRIGMEIEIRQLMANFKEVRAFFLSDAHQEEVARLEHFIDLCHQLKALKESGFLDAITDTILKLD
jgi:hypothetical protein